MIKILLVDDHTLVRKGIRLLLQPYPDIQIVGECHDGNDAIMKTVQLDPDVILMDLSMPNGLDGFTAAKEIQKHKPNVKIVMLTMYDEEVYVQQAVQLGVQGYILKNSHGEVLIEAIREVYQGNMYYRSSIDEDKIKRWLAKDSKEIHSVLTDREKEIVRMAALGFSNKEIAEKLLISIKTVENHKSNIFQKLHIKTKHELIQYAIQNKYLDLVF